MLSLSLESNAIVPWRRMLVSVVAFNTVYGDVTGCNNRATAAYFSLSFERWISWCPTEYYQQAWSSKSGLSKFLKLILTSSFVKKDLDACNFISFMFCKRDSEMMHCLKNGMDSNKLSGCKKNINQNS